MDSANPAILSDIQLFVETTLDNPDVEVDDLVNMLKGRGVTALRAEALLAFVPMACAHAIYAPQGVQFQPGFIIWDPESDRQRRGTLRDDPVFQAALDWAERHRDSSTSVQQVAVMSAEHAAISDLTSDGSTAQGCVITEPLLARVPLSYLE